MLIQFFLALLGIGLWAAHIFLLVLLIRALIKYLRSGERRKEMKLVARTLGEAIRYHRTRCKMTQEFVAESLGVSRQAVSKWENGTSDPSTTNLLALAKLFNIPAEALLNSVQETAEPADPV